MGFFLGFSSSLSLALLASSSSSLGSSLEAEPSSASSLPLETVTRRELRPGEASREGPRLRELGLTLDEALWPAVLSVSEDLRRSTGRPISHPLAEVMLLPSLAVLPPRLVDEELDDRRPKRPFGSRPPSAGVPFQERVRPAHHLAGGLYRKQVAGNQRRASVGEVWVVKVVERERG